jgi:acyl-CoA oxidase
LSTHAVAACTIAVRYSAVRRQGYDESGASEVAVLDYQSQQFRLLPLVAASWAFHLTGFELLRVTAETERALTGGDAKAGDAMARLHAAAAGLKVRGWLECRPRLAWSCRGCV